MLDLQGRVTELENDELAAKDAIIAAKDAQIAANAADLAKYTNAIQRMGLEGDSSWGFDWAATPVRTLDLTGYVETFRDDFNDPNTVMVDKGTTGGKWYSPARQNFVGAGINGTFNKSQITVANGECRLRIERVTPPFVPVPPALPNATSDWGVWRTAHMQTMSSVGVGFSQQALGSYFEARIKLPQQLTPYGWAPGTGLPIVDQRAADSHGQRASWTSFWLLSANEYTAQNDGKYGQEFDVFECYGGDQYIHSTMHLKPQKVPTPGYATQRQTNSNTKNNNWLQFDGNYHLYGVLYEEDFVTMFFDNKAVQRFEMTKLILDTPLYMCLTNVLGPDVSAMWAASSPIDMFVDHVRVLKKA